MNYIRFIGKHILAGLFLWGLVTSFSVAATTYEQYKSPPKKPDIVSFIHKTINTQHYSSYKLGGSRFDTRRGVYILDCSSFVDHILRATSPHAYWSLVNATGADSPASQHYFDFFSNLSDESSRYWNKVAEVASLRPGDILVFRYKNSHGYTTGGHVMVVMGKPVPRYDGYQVRVADSAHSRHSHDTRQPKRSGIGVGTILLKPDPRTGEPDAYAWGVQGYWNHQVDVAMARPTTV